MKPADIDRIWRLRKRTRRRLHQPGDALAARGGGMIRGGAGGGVAKAADSVARDAIRAVAMRRAGWRPGSRSGRGGGGQRAGRDGQQGRGRWRSLREYERGRSQEDAGTAARKCRRRLTMRSCQGPKGNAGPDGEDGITMGNRGGGDGQGRGQGRGDTRVQAAARRAVRGFGGQGGSAEVRWRQGRGGGRGGSDVGDPLRCSCRADAALWLQRRGPQERETAAASAAGFAGAGAVAAGPAGRC
jgi:hypothetical protein